jgi:hypothetical protein
MTKQLYKCLMMMAGSLALSPLPGFSKEGMWLPAQLKRQESRMQKSGLKIAVEQIYSDSSAALNDAVVIFGGGCTGEIVSPEGLLFTNHHCGYGTVQALSTADKNYLVDGFWAKSNAEELPCPGLSVTFIRQIKDVTDLVLTGLDDTLAEDIRSREIAKRIKNIETGYKKVTGLDAEVKPFYNGNQYWISVKEVFNDVRLVGFPPNGIGKFGGDTDNWMWPRETGDFGIFRVYAGKDNKPAAYDPSNVPYKPKKYFPISTAGYEEDDFTMVYGFPYTTSEYISSYQLNQIQHISDPIRIAAREKRLGVWDAAMRSNPNLFLKYAAKQSSVSNGFKKWKGEVRGLELNDVIGKKQKYEKEFQEVYARSPLEDDRMLLPRIQAVVNSSDNALIATEYTRETVLAIEAIQQAGALHKALTYMRDNKLGENALTDSLKAIKKTLSGFYKNYDAATDRKVFMELMPMYMVQENNVVPPQMKKIFYNAGNNYNSWAANIYGQSLVTNATQMYAFLDAASRKDSTVIKQDPAYIVYSTVQSWMNDYINPVMKTYNERMQPLNRMYMKRQLELPNSGKDFYPDANQTLRLTYGAVKGIMPSGGSEYSYQTTLDQMIARHNPSVEEFNIPQKLRDLHAAKDYGRWAVDGTVPIAFIATNHTSGGNSGSPVINGKGELIGINFDRIWDGTMSDLYYDPKLCRNIAVDIRYVLFIIEKFGDAGWLFKEMKLTK